MKRNCFNVNSVPIDHVPCVKPTIVLDPQGAILDQNQSVTLTVVASGSNPKTYQWYKNNLPIVGETDDELVLLYVDLVHAGEYRVNVMNACGSKMSNTAVVFVNDLGGPTCVPPTITAHPQPVVAEFGDNVTFNASVTGTPPFFYQWKKDNVNIPGATNNSLDIIYADDDAEGAYSVEIENNCGSVISAPAVLIVNSVINPGCVRPIITVQPLSYSVPIGTDVTLAATATGAGPITYQWFKDNLAIPGATNSSFSIIYAEEDDEGNYRVEATNSCGMVSSEFSFVVVEEPTDPGTGGGDGGVYLGDANLI